MSPDGWLTWISAEGGSIRIERIGDRSGRFPFPGWYFSCSTDWPLRWTPRLDRNSNLFLLSIPLWIPLLAAAVPTAFFVRAARRRGPGLCPSCGYDLTGAPAASATICPECGAGGVPRLP